MSYISKFKYDTAYSNVDIAEALNVITGAGVVPSTPNEILASYSTDGVTYTDKRCEVSISGSIVSIAPGTIIMPDGSYIIIYIEETFAIDTTEEYYVYIESVSEGNNVPRCTVENPFDILDSSKYVLLAEVNGGTVIGKRTFAKSKIEDFGTYIPKTYTYDTAELAGENGTIEITDITSFNYIVVELTTSGASGDATASQTIYGFVKDDCKCYGVYFHNSGYYSDDIYAFRGSESFYYTSNSRNVNVLKFSYADTKLTIDWANLWKDEGSLKLTII